LIWLTYYRAEFVSNGLAAVYIREVKTKHKTYLMLVESSREGQKVKQKTLLSFGATDSLEKGSLLAIAKKLLAYCDGNYLVDISEAEETQRKNWGAPAIIHKLWHLFSFDQFFTSLLRKSKIKFELEQSICLMLTDRFCSPRSKLQTYENRLYYSGFDDTVISLHGLYRTLDFLSKHKDEIEKHIYEQNKLLYGLEVDVIFFDVTTFYFESTKADDLKDFGYSKDAKFNEVQVVLSLLVNAEGRPIGFDLFEGNTYEGHTLTEAILKLKTKYQIKKAIIVADRGINSGLNLNKIKEHDCEYIMGCRIKNTSKEMQAQILDMAKYEIIDTGDEKEVLKYRVINYTKIIRENKKVVGRIEERIICTWSSKRARKDQVDRERLVRKAKEMLATNVLENKRGAKKYIKTNKQDEANLDEDKINRDSEWDGFYAIETSDKNISPENIMIAYHQLWRIEESFRLLKNHFETRPIFHWTPPRIKGHFILSYIAFLFERTLELELVKGGLPSSPQMIRDALSSMEFSEIIIGTQRYRLSAPLSELASNVTGILGIEKPPKIAVA
jgi:transposase